MKSTAIAPSNVAFIKYWGRIDDKLRLPTNGSISMNLSSLTTTTTVEFNKALLSDDIQLNGMKILEKKNRVSDHLDRIRNLAHIKTFAHVASNNSFPESTGLSSSASAFAALTVAGIAATGLALSEKEVSILARMGSGSACRSIPDGFVQWNVGKTSNESFACSLFSSSYWDVHDVVVVLSTKKKEVPTSVGQTFIKDNPFFKTRLQYIDSKLSLCKEYIQQKNFQAFGELIEAEALELHAMMLTSRPPLIYFSEKTIMLIKKIQTWRLEGLSVYFTINTGHNVHIICQKKDVSDLKNKLSKVEGIVELFDNEPSLGAHTVSNHLF